MDVIPRCPRTQDLFGSLPWISQLPLDLGFSRFIVCDPCAATRFVSFIGISLSYSQIQGVVVLSRRIPQMKFVFEFFFCSESPHHCWI